MKIWDDRDAIKEMKDAIGHFEKKMSAATVKAELFHDMARALKSARGWLDGAANCLAEGVQNVDRAYACRSMAREIEAILLLLEANHES